MSNEANQTSNTASNATAYGIVTGVMWGAAGVCMIVALMLIGLYVTRPGEPIPSDAAIYQAKLADLNEDPRNEQLANEVRALDLGIRGAYWQNRRLMETGGWILFVSAAVLIISMVTASEMKKRIPDPQEQTDKKDRDETTNAAARIAVGLFAACLVGLLIGAATFSHSEVGMTAALEAKAAAAPVTIERDRPVAVVAPAPKPLAIAPFEAPGSFDDYWPTFRGPNGTAASRYDNIPTKWDGATGEGIVWKSPVPLPGTNSPIVWGNRIFLSGADKETREVYAFDANSGKIVWQTPIPATPESEGQVPKVMEKDTGYAAPTLATNGQQLFGMFANGDVVALSLDGKILWTRGLGIPDNIYGHSASPTVFEDMVIIQYDQGAADDGLSKVLALDAATGETRWETPRDMGSSWPSPIIVTIAGEPQLIAAGSPYVVGYDPKTGEELWRAEATDGDMGPTPVASGDMVFTATEYLQLSAIDATGRGDITDSHIRWVGDYCLPDTSSPLVLGDTVITVENSGYLGCYRIEDGDQLWEFETDASSAYGSPGVAGGKIYLFAPDGFCYIIQPGPTEATTLVAAMNPLAPDADGEPEGCVTSPAFQDGRIYVRGFDNLYCIGAAE